MVVNLKGSVRRFLHKHNQKALSLAAAPLNQSISIKLPVQKISISQDGD